MTQSEKRFLESVGKIFTSSLPDSFCLSFNSPSQKTQQIQKTLNTALFLTSSSDLGVIRNGGRNGARFAPSSLLAQLKKMTLPPELEKKIFYQVEVSSPEIEDFNSSQQQEISSIHQALSHHTQGPTYHLGGGHDHIYPLVMSLSLIYEKIVVINIDAHADTRDDMDFSSGTPFRQISNQLKDKFLLFQIGLNRFANSKSTLSSLKESEQHQLWWDEFFHLSKEEREHLWTQYFQKIQNQLHQLHQKHSVAVVFSLDADALEGKEMPAVSAPNPTGLSFRDLYCLWSLYLRLPLQHPPITGIYEFNPLFDQTGALAAKTLASFIFWTLMQTDQDFI